jgi:hypothetical protein
MSKTLNRRVGNLERKMQGGRGFYCLKVATWDSICYWILRSREMEQKHYDCSTGPFRSVGAARDWSLEDLEASYPRAYERLLKKRSLENLYADRWLTVETTSAAEFIEEMLRTDVDLGALPADERKLRMSYLSQAEEMKALHAELMKDDAISH